MGLALRLFLVLLSLKSMSRKVIPPGAWVGSEEGTWERLAVGCMYQSPTLPGTKDLDIRGRPTKCLGPSLALVTCDGLVGAQPCHLRPAWRASFWQHSGLPLRAIHGSSSEVSTFRVSHEPEHPGLRP